MAYDQWGRWIPDYQPQSPVDYREELRKQRDLIDHRLLEIDSRYQTSSAQPVSVPPTSGATYMSGTQPQAPEVIAQPYIVVASEKEAREYPIVNKIDDKIGQVHIFVTSDEKTMIAKRINPGTFESEVEIYDRRAKSISDDVTNDEGEDLLVSIDARLKRIEGIVDTAVSMFMNKGVKQEPVEQEED